MSTATQTRTFVTTKGESIESFLTDEAAAKVINANPEKVNTFARSLARDYAAYGRLTERQLPYLHKFALELVAPEPEEPQEEGAVVLDLASIWEMMARAGEHLKHPKITFELDEGKLRLHRAGEMSRTPGAIMVTDGGSFGNNIFYGRVHTGGQWEPSRVEAPWVVKALQELAADPAGFAAAYGKRTGNCCFCARDLTDPRSVGVGYGPVCADRYGLPWGA